MSHLLIERLAALADEQPTADEQAHLARCAECTRELDAIRSLVSMAGAEREPMGVPLTRWETLAKRLRSEGLIARPAGRFQFSSRAVLQIAAALLLVAGGIGVGRLSTGEPVIPGGISGSEMAAGPDSIRETFTSAEDAADWQAKYYQGYQNAMAYLASNNPTSDSPASLRRRLSALDRMSTTMRQAIQEAPADPVINDFYLNSFGQREATLRQLTASLPAGARLNSY